MRGEELDRDQLVRLKQQLLDERLQEEGRSPSWGELADADSLISDEEVLTRFAGYDFVPEDFF